MLRSIFVVILMLTGIFFAVQSAFYGLLMYLWIAYFRPEAWAWDEAFVQSLNLSLIAGVYLMLRSVGSDARFKLDLRSGLLFLFLILCVASTATSSYVKMSSFYFQDFIKLLVITYMLASLTTDSSRVRLVLFVIAMSLAFENAKQGWITLLLHPGSKNINAVAGLGDENETAVGLLMLAPVLLALAKTAAGKWERRFHQFLGVGVTYRAISTYSRGGFLSLGAMALVYVARSKHKLRDAVVMLAVGGTLLSVLPDSFWERMSTITVNENDRDRSAESRPHFWRVATNMALDHPLLGVGHFGFEKAYDRYDFSRGRYGMGRAVHSSWFGILAEFGFPGFFVFVALWLLAVAACEQVIRKSQRGEIPPEFREYSVAIQTGLIVFAFGGAFVTFQYHEIPWHYIGISMALRNAAEAAVSPKAAAPAPFKPAQINTAFGSGAAAWRRA